MGQLLTAEQYFAGKVCEVCQAQATHAVGDVIEVEPQPAQITADGESYYVNWKPGGAHFFCEEHKRESRETRWFASDEAAEQWLAEQRKKAG